MNTQTTEAPETKPQSPFAQFDEYRAKQQKTAVENPILHVSEIAAAFENPIYRQNFDAGNGTAFQILMTITTRTAAAEVLCWRASFAFITKLTGNVKAQILWTNREKKIARKILGYWLENVGEGSADDFSLKHNALHAIKELSFEEIDRVLQQPDKQMLECAWLPETVERDELGEWFHSILINAPDETPFNQLPGADKMEFSIVEFFDDAPEHLQEMYEDAGRPDSPHLWSDAVKQWQPTTPEGAGWFLLGIYDSEDGHCACFARPKQ